MPLTRSPHQIRTEGNRLRDEPSLYLRQHAHNPVDWYPWASEALELARREDKPIFLSVGYSSCHWCHVMEREVFEDDEAAALLNEHYVCIKVDREERPDLDAAYMQALQAMTGGGGWPMSLFLTPEQQPFFAATYLPRDRFLVLAARLHTLLRDNRGAITAQAAHLAGALAEPPQGAIAPVPDGRLLADVTERAVIHSDPEWGGARGAMKFPTPCRWLFLLHRHRRTGGERLATALRTTLDAIASGGIRDHIGGGFHRYTVERTWLIPHFEKMLYDNAQLASLFLEAAVILDEPRYRDVAGDTLDFLLREMRDPAGGFYASFDADSEGGEGLFYLWRRAELIEVAGADDGPPLADLLGATAAGNLGGEPEHFVGRSVLTRRQSPDALAARFAGGTTEAATLFERWRSVLREHRARRPPPVLDRKVIASWNGLTISALARGYALLGDERYLAAAVSAASYLWRVHRRADGALLRASGAEGVARHEGVLSDYANLAAALLDLFQASQDPAHLRRAVALIEQIRRRFVGPHGALFITSDAHEAPLGRQQELFDSVRPSAGSTLVHLLLRAGALLGDQGYRQLAEEALAAQAGLLRRAGIEMAWWLDAADLLLGPLVEVVIAGDPARDETRALVETFHRLQPAHALLAVVPAAGPGAELGELLPTTRGKAATDGTVQAFVCRHGSCQAPTSDPATLRAQILEGWDR